MLPSPKLYTCVYQSTRNGANFYFGMFRNYRPGSIEIDNLQLDHSQLPSPTVTSSSDTEESLSKHGFKQKLISKYKQTGIIDDLRVTMTAFNTSHSY